MGGRGTAGASRANGATKTVHDKTVTYGGYKWELHPNATRGSRVLLVDVDKLEANWSQFEHKSFYIGPGEEGIGGRRAGVKEYLKTGKPIQSPKVGIDKHGNIHFVDGRHRFATMRDMGVKKIGITVSKADYEKMKRKFGG